MPVYNFYSLLYIHLFYTIIINASIKIFGGDLGFATRIRISELCSLKITALDLQYGIMLIFGKGSKERKIHIGNPDVISILHEYNNSFTNELKYSDNFFVNQNSPLSDQSVRRIIRKYCSITEVDLHITPHVFRHTLATSLL